jgi:hypothetical protein
MLMVRLLVLLAGQPDTVLVEVILVEAQQRVLIEAVTQDSTLLLPTAPLYELLGLGTPTSPHITPESLQRAYPTTRVVWSPLEGRLYVFDPLSAFPESRRAHAEIVMRSQAAFSLPIQSGPFAALSVDDSLHALLDAGYDWRGRVSVAGRVDDTKAGSWGATIAPNPHVFLNYQDGTARPPTVSGRIAAGPFWFSASATPHSPLDMSGLIRFGDVQAFASRDYGIVTMTPAPQWSAQIARNWRTGQTATRISVGPSYASPFSFPITTLRR